MCFGVELELQHYHLEKSLLVIVPYDLKVFWRLLSDGILGGNTCLPHTRHSFCDRCSLLVQSAQYICP